MCGRIPIGSYNIYVYSKSNHKWSSHILNKLLWIKTWNDYDEFANAADKELMESNNIGFVISKMDDVMHISNIYNGVKYNSKIQLQVKDLYSSNSAAVIKADETDPITAIRDRLELVELLHGEDKFKKLIAQSLNSKILSPPHSDCESEM